MKRVLQFFAAKRVRPAESKIARAGMSESMSGSMSISINDSIAKVLRLDGCARECMRGRGIVDSTSDCAAKQSAGARGAEMIAKIARRRLQGMGK